MTWSEIPWRPAPRVLRQFAVCWTLFVGLLAWRVGLQDGRVAAAWALAAAAGAVGLVGLVRPAAVRPLFLALLIAVLPINWAASRLLLAVLYYGVFTPTGVVLRILRRDALELRPRADRSTYWQGKPLVDDPSRYYRPF